MQFLVQQLRKIDFHIPQIAPLLGMTAEALHKLCRDISAAMGTTDVGIQRIVDGVDARERQRSFSVFSVTNNAILIESKIFFFELHGLSLLFTRPTAAKISKSLRKFNSFFITPRF